MFIQRGNGGGRTQNRNQDHISTAGKINNFLFVSVCGLKPATFSRVRIGQGFEAGGLFAAVFCGFCVAGRFAGLAGG